MISDEKNSLEVLTIKLAEKICRSNAFPMMIVDDQLICVYSNRPKIVSVGTVLSFFVKEPIEIPLKMERDVLLILKKDNSNEKNNSHEKDKCYCARFFPIDEKYSFCELLDIYDIMTLASYTDMYSVIEQRFALLRESTDNVKKFVDNLKEELPPRSRLECMRTIDVDSEVVKLNSQLNGLSEYVYIALSSNGNNDIIDTYDLINWLVNRSNTFLSNHGKCIELICDIGEYYIRVDHRHAVIALLSAIQNALFYSPIKNVPIVSLTKKAKDDKNYIVLQILNDLENYTEANKKSDPDFACRRCGLGIPVIKKFVQRADGEFYFEESSSKAKLGIMIPEVDLKEKDRIVLKSDSFSVYDIGGQDVVEAAMTEVISYISKKKKRH